MANPLTADLLKSSFTSHDLKELQQLVSRFNGLKTMTANGPLSLVSGTGHYNVAGGHNGSESGLRVRSARRSNIHRRLVTYWSLKPRSCASSPRQ